MLYNANFMCYFYSDHTKSHVGFMHIAYKTLSILYNS